MDCENIYYLLFNKDFDNTIKCFLLEISTRINLSVPALKFNGLFLNDTYNEFNILTLMATRVQNKGQLSYIGLEH